MMGHSLYQLQQSQLASLDQRDVMLTPKKSNISAKHRFLISLNNLPVGVMPILVILCLVSAVLKPHDLPELVKILTLFDGTKMF